MERNSNRPHAGKINLWIGSAFAAFTVWWVALILIPVVAVLSRAGSAAWLDPLVLAIARLTLNQALLSTFFSALIGLPLGLWIGSLGRRGSRISLALLAVPYGVPTVVAGAAWILWLGRSGILAHWGIELDWAYSLKAVILAHVFFNAPWIALLVAQSRLAVSSQQLEAAQTLGASPWQKFLTILWPAVHSAFFAAMAQAFSLCAMSFALVLILGGGPQVQTLEVALYGAVRGGNLDLGEASSFALWELLITLAPWTIWILFRQETPIRRLNEAQKKRGTRTWLESVFGILIALIFIFPYLALGTSGISLRESIAAPFWLSLEISIASGLLALLFAVLALVLVKFSPRAKKWAEVLVLMPSGISVLVLGLGFFLAYRNWIDPFSGSLSAMILLQGTLFTPLVFRTLLPRLSEVRTPLLEAARTMGASQLRAFREVEWPHWRPSLLSAFALAMGASLGEVAAVSLFYSEKLIPLPLLISRWIGQYRFEEARSLSFLLFLMSALLIFGISYWGNREPNS